MSEFRKVFRIEKTAARRLSEAIEETQAGLAHAALMQELGTLRIMLAAALRRSPGNGDAPLAAATGRLASELHLIHGAVSGNAEELAGRNASHSHPIGGGKEGVTRIAHELAAVIDGTEQATQKILAAAESIDQVANNLSAALAGKIEQGLAQDIQDLVIHIFEACNFQDLISQRVTKVMATLKFVEDHIARVLEEIESGAPAEVSDDDAQVLHGPRLASDPGHITQHDVDAMFGSGRSSGAAKK